MYIRGEKLLLRENKICHLKQRALFYFHKQANNLMNRKGCRAMLNYIQYINIQINGNNLLSLKELLTY